MIKYKNNLKDKKNKKPNKTKIMLFSSALFAGMITSAIVTDYFSNINSSIRITDKIVEMKSDVETTNEEVLLDEPAFYKLEQQNSNEQGSVVNERSADDPNYIFKEQPETRYNLETINIKKGPTDNSENYAELEKGSTIQILGYNEYGYAKIKYDGKDLYIKTDVLIDDLNYIFNQVNSTMYIKETTNAYSKLYEEGDKVSTLSRGTKIMVTGTNDSGYAEIDINGVKAYVSTSVLSSEEVVPTYLKKDTDGNTTYYTSNMYDGVLSTVPESEKTERNLILLAKIIHCEAGGQTEEGKLAVGTVVVNRAYDGTMGNTIESVIYRPGQFSPVGSGKFANCTYTKSDLAAAKKILYDGYRSFPAYVLYFQSIRDGYFAGHRTYCIAYNADGTHPQYFSYKTSDLNKYIK